MPGGVSPQGQDLAKKTSESLLTEAGPAGKEAHGGLAMPGY